MANKFFTTLNAILFHFARMVKNKNQTTYLVKKTLRKSICFWVCVSRSYKYVGRREKGFFLQYMRILLYLITVKQYIALVKYNYDYVDEQEHIARKKKSSMQIAD